ncbi:hypothetical protein CYMTET_18665 [Cymbomonas tetramitiformis]|uniref:HIT domain-containing protein n=1 Tax=Cymbomonas tetramitiformis TaxID=36881 RepID=A0AAE0G7L8_9CHLO|nr:hypothetical protein CYMTET_18665 [Cymbomonas tetramitiformis]
MTWTTFKNLIFRSGGTNDDRGYRHSCIFCRIATGEEFPGHSDNDLLHNDDKLVAFKDIKPAATRHYLVIPKMHVASVRTLNRSKEDHAMICEMLKLGKELLHRDAPGAETRFGFHVPPFNSVDHIHLHCFALPFSPAWKESKYRQYPFLPFATFMSEEEVLKRTQPDVGQDAKASQQGGKL